MAKIKWSVAVVCCTDNCMDIFFKKLPSDCDYQVVESPVGPLLLIADQKALLGLIWYKASYKKQLRGHNENPQSTLLKKANKQLKEYFNGQRKDFDIPLRPLGTEFQSLAWEQLQKIPYGQTISYQDQAKKLGDTNKARAVGMANSRNCIAIIIPCHRVISKSGGLCGFASGTRNKKYLLQLEQAL